MEINAMDGRTTFRFALVFLILFQTGCQLCNKHSASQNQIDNRAGVAKLPSESGGVFVSGLIENPRSISLGNRPASLAQIVSQLKIQGESVENLQREFVGTGTDTDDDEAVSLPIGRALVALRREARIGAQTYYFPLQLIRHGAAGELSVKDGDIVRVLDLFQLPEFTGGTAPVSVAGLVENPGNVKLEGGVGTFSDLENAAGVLKGKNEPTAITLTRRSSGLASIEHFVIPRNGTMYSDFQVGSGDVVFYTQLEKAPILISGLVDQISRNKSITTDVDRKKLRRPRTRVGRKIQQSVRYPTALIR